MPYSYQQFPDTTQLRKERFMAYLEALGKYPRKEQAFHDTTLRYVKQGQIPWNRDSEGYRPEEYDETWGIHSSYFITIFISTGRKAVLMDEEKLRSNLREHETWSPSGFYPNDGSKGQAKAANSHKIQAYKWFLCEWDGEWKSPNHPEPEEA